jgi:hypothetical protein
MFKLHEVLWARYSEMVGTVHFCSGGIEFDCSHFESEVIQVFYHFAGFHKLVPELQAQLRTDVLCAASATADG